VRGLPGNSDQLREIPMRRRQKFKMGRQALIIMSDDLFDRDGSAKSTRLRKRLIRKAVGMEIGLRAQRGRWRFGLGDGCDMQPPPVSNL
jgi:hypothetical protein